MTRPRLAIEDLHFHYGDRAVLAGVSLHLEPGAGAALAGPNGAGKTTLLRLIAGTLTPASGRILLDGVPLQRRTRRQIAREVALVPQQLEVPFDFTVQQIVEQGRTPYRELLRGIGGADRRAVEQALELTDLHSLRDRVFNELSGGERQRVKIALGLAQQPQLLLLDEPAQNLDIGRQAELLDLLQHLRAQGLTILASMHELHLIPDHFSAVHLLSAQGVLRSGAPDEVLTPENLVPVFALAPGRHRLRVPGLAARRTL